MFVTNSTITEMVDSDDKVGGELMKQLKNRNPNFLKVSKREQPKNAEEEKMDRHFSTKPETKAD